MAASLTQLPKTMTMRMVFDAGTTPTDYTRALNTFRSNSYLMGLIEDSSDMRLRSAAALEFGLCNGELVPRSVQQYETKLVAFG